MLETLITSKTRMKLILKFFLNSGTASYLRDLEGEFGESTNSIRIELNRFLKAGLLHTEPNGNKKMFRANTMHPLYKDINSLLRKYIGLDQLIEKVIIELGGVQTAFLTGNFAKGLDSRFIDIVLIGNKLNSEYMSSLVTRAEGFIKRKIRYVLLEPEEAPIHLKEHPEALLLWTKEEDGSSQ